MTLRFAVVISHPNQHHCPVFKELNQVPGIRVKAFYGSDFGVRPSYDAHFNQTFTWDVPLLDGHEYEFLSRGLPPGGPGIMPWGGSPLGALLTEFAPHAIWVHGYGHWISWQALRWASGRSAVLYFGDSELLHHRPWTVRLFKAPLVRWFFRRCDAFLTIGDNNEAYYAHYGVPASAMVRGAYPVDVQRFRSALNDPGRPSRAEMRRRFGLPSDATVVLFLAKMIPIKRPGDVVEAIGILRKLGTPAHALFIGDGPLRPGLEERVRDNELQEYVHFAGFVNQKEMPLVLDCGDILAMTSEKDPHPLAVTESMIAGNVIVASDRVGCVGPTDTVRPGVNGLVYPCGNVEALADALRLLIQDGQRRQRMAAMSRQLASTQEVRVTVGAVLRALLQVRPKFAERWRDLPEAVFQTIEEHAVALPTPDALTAAG